VTGASTRAEAHARLSSSTDAAVLAAAWLGLLLIVTPADGAPSRPVVTWLIVSTVTLATYELCMPRPRRAVVQVALLASQVPAVLAVASQRELSRYAFTFGASVPSLVAITVASTTVAAFALALQRWATDASLTRMTSVWLLVFAAYAAGDMRSTDWDVSASFDLAGGAYQTLIAATLSLTVVHACLQPQRSLNRWSIWIVRLLPVATILITLAPSRSRGVMTIVCGVGVVVGWLIGVLAAQAGTAAIARRRADDQAAEVERAHARLTSLKAETHDGYLNVLERITDAAADGHLSKVQALAHEATRHVRTVHDIGAMRYHGFDEALFRAASSAVVGTETQLQYVTGRVSELADRLPQKCRDGLLQVTRTLVGNAAKHGAARSVSVRVAGESHLVAVFVADDGLAPADGVYRRNGYGLRSADEFAAETGGTFHVSRREGTPGTVATISVPITGPTDNSTRSAPLSTTRHWFLVTGVAMLSLALLAAWAPRPPQKGWSELLALVAGDDVLLGPTTVPDLIVTGFPGRTAAVKFVATESSLTGLPPGEATDYRCPGGSSGRHQAFDEDGDGIAPHVCSGSIRVGHVLLGEGPAATGVVPDAAAAGGDPPPGATLVLTRGSAAPAGYWYDISVVGLSPSAAFTLVCHDSLDSRFFTETATADENGAYRDATLCYSGDGPDHWVTVGSERSNTVPWGSGGYIAVQGSRGSDTFQNTSNASGVGPRVAANQSVQVTCRKNDPGSVVTSNNAKTGGNWWYFLSSSPWDNAYWAPSTTFMNGDTAQTPPDQWTDVDTTIRVC
jgi:signal transduction histidine kinase